MTQHLTRIQDAPPIAYRLPANLVPKVFEASPPGMDNRWQAVVRLERTAQPIAELPDWTMEA
jgi:hypothetical protein